MKNKLTTLILTAALGVFAVFSAKADGDIYDIRPCDANGVDLSTGTASWSSYSSPLGSGETVYFKMRLVARQIAGGKATGRWYLDYDGLMDETIADSLYPMQIGIYVSGVKTYATLVGVQPEGDFTTSLIFSYTTQPGDFAMPVRLATETGPAGIGNNDGAYVFNDLRSYWKMSCVTTNVTAGAVVTNVANCSWLLCTDSRVSFGYLDITGTTPSPDYSLEQCGIYVQTVDFSDDFETETYWRTIHENSTITGNGVSPRLSISAASEEARTFYVWSDDESVAQVKTDNTVTMQIDNGGTMGTYHVGKVTFEGGVSDDMSFLVQAMTGAEGKTANLILSAYPNFNYSASSGDQLQDFITVPIYVSEALPASIIVECADTTVAADHDYLTAKTSLSVYLSQAATNDVTVTLKTTFEDDATKTNWGDYVRFSASANTQSTLPDPDEITFTIPKGSTEKKIIYVYTLRGDNHTVGDGHQVKFSGYVSPEEMAAAGIQDNQDAGLWISAAKPVITTPDSTSAYDVTAGEKLEITVAVEDTYADMTDTNEGYTVRIKTGSTAGWTTLAEKFKASGEDGELVGITTGNPPSIEYPSAGEQTSQIQVTAPISGKKSEIVSFTVNVSPAKTTSATSLDANPDNYTEGDVVKFRVSLSSQNDTGAPIYAFLLCNEDIDLSMFGGTASKAILTSSDTAVPASVGRQISTVGTFTDSSFTVLDGLSNDDGGQNYTFSVVLCSTKNYDPDNRLPGYDTTEMLNITVYNKEPLFDYVYLNGFETENGITFGTQFPRGQDQSIQPYFKDVSYDLKHGFEYKWTASRDGKAEANGIVAHNPDTTVTEVTSVTNGNKITTYIPDGQNINDYPMVYSFPRAGTWTVKLQMKDKDMTSYAEETYSVIFDVLANPSVTITPEDSYDENNNKASIDVGLAYFDSDDSIVVKLTVTAPAGTGANLGTLVLSDEFKVVPTGYAALADNEYYVVFDSATTISVDIDSMDGTVVSASKGFTLKAEVVSTGLAPDGTTWANYYLSSSEKIYINNVMPEFGYVTQENTNAWKVAGGAATSYPINWAVRRDVDYDFTDPWSTGEGPGIKVTFAGCENATTFYVELDDDWNGKFIPNFGSVQGEQNVILTIEDKDGGMNTWTYMYLVTPSKTIITVPNGPTGIGNSSLSQKYAAAIGRGEGHIYPQNVTFSSATQNALTWFGSGLSQVAVYGFGYEAGAVDNGYLDGGMDQAISATGGNAVKPATEAVIAGYYTYDSEFDSYLYGWIISTPTSEAGVTEWTFSMAPARPLAAAVPVYAMLPSAMTEDETFVPVMVEGIFSREFLASDNLGDINLDGIPDLLVNTYSLLGDPAAGNAGAGEAGGAAGAANNDLNNLAAFNDDLDKLPGFCTYGAGAGVSQENQNSYAPVGIDFTAILEIRGFHEGLNDTHFTTSDAYFSEDEQLAWEAYAAANGLDPAVYNLAEWSPEPTGSFPRMDPTVEDTDGDTFPDGWEYFFWYQAKVGKPAADAGSENEMGLPRVGQQFLFERFDPTVILYGTEITADEVLARFNPCQANTDEYARSPDFDGDGLIDYEELLIGTNPCHWDTDGDVMPDGWEVMMNLDPLGMGKSGNSDGDFMACIITEGMAMLDLGDGTYLVDINNNIDGGNSEWIDGTTRELLVDVTGDWAIVVPLLDGNGDPVTYGRSYNEELAGEDRPLTWHWGYRMILSAEFEERTLAAGTQVANLTRGEAFIILHDQVRDLCGFDPRTAWYSDADGYVASRWNPSINMSLNQGDVTGLAVNTEPYCDYDEYLLLLYRNLVRHYTDDARYNPNDMWATFGSFTTNPSVAYPVLSTNEMDAATSTNVTTIIAETLAQAFAQAGSTKSTIVTHGADTDQDGVPDGWELYVGRNPSAAPSVRSMEGTPPGFDLDEDGLGYVAEYSGTDSCNAYADCESIYSLHPGNETGWFNKFFPTNPDDPDTDGDGIFDADEGQGWTITFHYAGQVYEDISVSFIYGTPADSFTCCVRGGGLNPCTVDTDLDGLPDAWERQYAGLPTDPAGRKYVPPEGGEFKEIAYDNSTWIADGIATEFTGGSNVVYIAAGMDGTWGGDAWTDVEEGGNSFDPLLGTLRDVDFDHDGLQNGQEYLVQQVRHFRYDDITTPLMGRYIDEGQYDPMNAMGPLLSGHTYVNVQAYVPMSQSPGEFVANALLLWLNDTTEVTVETNVVSYSYVFNEITGEIYTNATVEVVTNIVAGSGVIADKALGNAGVYHYMYSRPWDAEGWAANGYFAPPKNEWDRIIASGAFESPVIMLPVGGAYVSTDPRIADTDMDGMDDYYEMFHGLNPLLGTTEAGTEQDIIAVAYGQPGTFNAYYNEWTHSDFNRMAALFGFPGSVVNPEPLQDKTSVDPLLYPWVMGANEVDADGDGLRNDAERITANLTSPLAHHTDPTPLWFTDSSSPNSYVSLYYVNSTPTQLLPLWPPIDFDYCFSFEETEGYDTDNDWRGDAHEIIKTVRPTSDPLDFSDPSRRQALYLDGNRSFAATRERNERVDGLDFYKQFTVEAWIRPEKVGSVQTIIDRCCLYGYDANTKEDASIRSNFRIGLTADGRIFGMYDNDDAIVSGSAIGVSCIVLNGPEVPLNEWTHVAMTYNGENLILYVNGIERSRIDTQLIPANGVTAILQDPSYTNTLFGVTYRAEPSSFFIGGRPNTVAQGGTEAFSIETIEYDSMNDDEWYQGYIDEVRIWDGARTASEISSNYKKHMTQDDVSANREEIYTRLMSEDADSSRNDNDNLLDLAAELVQLYAFSTLPGAVNAADVAKIPVGFDIAVEGQLLNKTDAFSQNVGWWDACLTKSTVYNDYTVVPWIENAVRHLPVIDGSVVDSFLYSDYLGGYYTLASENELPKYTLNNSAMPYAQFIDNFDPQQRLFRLNRLLEAKPDNALVQDLVNRYEFEIRMSFSSTDDLIPMGGAYAKTCPEMWDGNGVADAWEISAADTDADGLPDWWEDIYGLDPSGTHDWNVTVTWNGAELPAYVAYTADLAMGMQPDGTYNPDYASTADVDGDNIPDWWETLFGVNDYDGDDDPDNDGLSNYSEYLISFGAYPYGVTNGWVFVSPLNAYSTSADQRVPDYFLRTPKTFDDNGRHVYEKEYYGEIFTDHDFMETWWESAYANSYASTTMYDPDRDADGDGWDNWSEVRAATWSGTLLSDLVTKYLSDQVTLNNYPQPSIGLRFTYNGIQNISGKSVVVRTMTKGNARTDATFTIAAPEADEVRVATYTPGAFIDSKTLLHGQMQPGCVIPTSCYVYGVHLSKEGVFYWGIDRAIAPGLEWVYSAGTVLNNHTILTKTDGSQAICWYCTGTFEEYRSDLKAHNKDYVILDNPSLDFSLIGRAVSRDDGTVGDIKIHSAESSSQSVFGNVNFKTGEFTLDPSVLEAADLAPNGMLVRIEYSYSISSEWPQTLWFNNPTTGRVKQGNNTIEAWIDLNGDGVYTAGEPYGIVRNVNVGWHKTAETVIELKDTSTIIPHYLLSDGTSDRTVVKGLSGGVAAASSSSNEGGEDVEEGSSGLMANVVVRRIGINGSDIIGKKTVPVRTLVAKEYVLDDRAYITEADVLSDDKFDLDWKWLVSDATKLGLAASDIKTVEYEIDQVVSLPGGAVTNIALATFINEFNNQRPIPVVREPVSVAPVYSAAPTFSWSCDDETMTAFRLQVSTSTNANDIIYDSGVMQLPGRRSITAGVNAYSFAAPIYIGDPVTTNGAPVFLDGSNYFWRVTEFNAKFNTVDEKYWSSWAEFQMDVANENRLPMTKTGYGKCGAVVRYFGPNTNNLEGIVVVEAHRSADFNDQPLAQLRADISQLDDIDDIETVNAAFTGIDPGTVYLMAYIDANNNGKRDSNESWGYSHYIGTDALSIFSPRDLTVTDELYLTSEPPKVVIYIEDTDINRNEIPDCFETSTTSSSTTGDSDKDGIADDEEDGYATDAAIWDTDGDGMPDGWEVLFADLDPNFDDAAESADDDVMAFALIDATIVTIQNTDGSAAVNYILKTGAEVPTVGGSADGLELFEIYDYPVVISNEVENYYGRGQPVTLTASAGTTNRVQAVISGKVALIHAQVYDEYGFDKTTASPSAYREGTAANTKPFTALDKYLVIRYLEAIGACNEESVNVDNLWAQYSLKPYDTDNDNDGILDGWELYVMFGDADDKAAAFATGNIISPWNFNDRFLSFDGGELMLIYEYDRGNASTDPWNDNTITSAFTDYYAWLYNIKTPEGQLSDNDNDGLTNIQEYEAYIEWGLELDIYDMMTDGETIDYFRTVDVGGKQHYIGELVADHDFMEDYIEDVLGFDRGLYDATKDDDKDGWSNWSEARAYTLAGIETITEIVTNLTTEGIETQKLSIVRSRYAGRPYPTVTVSVAYSGEKDIDAGNFVIEAYANSMMQKKLCWWTVAATSYEANAAHNGYVTFELGAPDHGYLKEGMTHFAVYADLDGSGTYAAAEPFGIVKDVDVGFNRAVEFTVELTDTTPVIPRVDFINRTCDRVVLEGVGTNNSHFVWATTSSAAGTEGVEGAVSEVTTSVGGEEVRVRVIRTAINGDTLAKKRTLLNRVFTIANRSYLHEGDFFTRLKSDLDPYLAVDAKAIGIAPSAVSEATYEIILGNAKYKAGETNESVIATFMNTYPAVRTTGTPLAPSANSRGIVTTSQPTFEFSADTASYTSYALQVATDEGFGNIIYVTTNLLSGAVKGTISVTPPCYFEDGVTRYWRVALLNGKYNTFDKLAPADVVWSDPATFTVDLRGEATAEVKYFGPAETDGKIVVEAYVSPDFVGDPVARVQGGSLIDGTNALAIAGLPSGKLYLLAFVDRNGDGVRQSYESWGYACKVGTEEKDLWTPVPVTINANVIGDPVVTTIYIEDTDINQNFVIDPLDDEEDLKAAEEAIESEGSDDSNDMSDRDGDGLMAYEEDEIGTDSDNVDSDGDGMWDGWEVWAATDPLTPDADYAVEGDVMAYAEVTRTLVTTRSTLTGLQVTYILDEGEIAPVVGSNMNSRVMHVAYEYGKSDLYGIGILNEVPTSAEYILATVKNTTEGTTSEFLFDSSMVIDVGTNVTDYVAYEIAGTVSGLYILGAATNLVVDTTIVDPTSSNVVTAVSSANVSLGENRVIEVDTAATVALIHNQVYQEYGFNMKTASGDSYKDGSSVNTKEFTALDKYLLIRYFEAQGLCDEKTVNATSDWASWSLMPGVIDGDWGDADGRYGDGVADGWELYVGKNPWNFYDREDDDDGDGLPLYLEFDRGHIPTSPWLTDSDKDGVTDYNAWKYHLKGSEGINDADGDGLSNYVEYMLTEVFKLGNFSADNAFSVNAYLSDYFFPIGQLYAGYVFTDHDRTQDSWESAYLVANDTVSPYLYDSDKDADGDGWSNYAEFQAGTDPTRASSIGIDGVEMDEYPVPIVEFSVGYIGPQNVNTAPIVVKAWSDPTLATIPDARWTLGAVGETTTTENGNENTVNGLKYLGMNPMREKLIHLSPGSVEPGTVKIEFKDVSWILLDVTTQQTYFYGAEFALWFHMLGDKAHSENSRYGDIIDEGTSEVVGSIDYVTGALTIDFTSLRETLPIDGNIAEDLGNQDLGGNLVSLYDVAKSYVRVNWASKLLTGSGIKTYYLGDADDPDETNNSCGHLKEGKNTFIAFYDLDGDGMYTVGEPYGTARDVDVGWNYAKVAIELTDTTPITARYKLTAGMSSSTTDSVGGDLSIPSISSPSSSSTTAATDREALYPDNCTDVFTIPTVTAIAAPEKEYVRVRLARYAVDSWDYGLLPADCVAIVYDRVMDLTADGHPTLTEADILSMVGNEFDIDWEASKLSSEYKDLTETYSDLNGKTLADGKTRAVFTNIYYVAYIGNDAITAQCDTNANMLTKVIVRKFGLNRVTPEPISGSTEIQTTAPTFKWRSSDSTYTAFKVRVKDAAGEAIWTSDYQLMPPRDDNGIYSWTAPLRVGSIVPGGTEVFANNANYSWDISTYNAKFKADSYVPGGSFYVNVLTNSLDYATAKVAVRYYGPANVASGIIRVQAFSTPDFSGDPVGEGYVTNKTELDSTAEPTTANAMILGLTAGTYYIRAFIDTQNDGNLSSWMDGAGRVFSWESWGCYCTRDVSKGTIYTPKSITVGPEAGASSVIPVYIDDCDSDQDTLPDAWEWVQEGDLTSLTASSIDQNSGGFAMKQSLTGAINANGSVSSGLAVLATTALKSSRIAALLLDVEATGTDAEVVDALNSATSDANAEAKKVVITDIVLDRENGTVSITADTEGEVTGSAISTSQIYEFASGDATLTLTCKVLHSDTLAGDWDVIATGTVEVEFATKTYTFTLDDEVDLDSGFFKVTLE